MSFEDFIGLLKIVLGGAKDGFKRRFEDYRVGLLKIEEEICKTLGGVKDGFRS
jgi:hypothetical protein